jgi:hypothetical protein
VRFHDGISTKRVSKHDEFSDEVLWEFRTKKEVFCVASVWTHRRYTCGVF